MDECDSLCPNKQTIQNTAKPSRGLNLGLRFVASQNPNPNPDLASSQASLNFTSGFSNAVADAKPKTSQHLHGNFGFPLALRAREWQSIAQRAVCLSQLVFVSIDQFGKLNSGREWPCRPTSPGSMRRCLCPTEYLCQRALKINNKMLLLQRTLTFSRERNEGEVGRGEERGKQSVPRMKSTGTCVKRFCLEQWDQAAGGCCRKENTQLSSLAGRSA